jgi:hypothetical protein
MIGEKKMFTSYVKNKDSQDTIIFGDGNQGKVKGLGKIAITNEHSISNVFLVESLGYNILSVSQLCHMCRCFGSDRTPGDAPQGVFRSRTVSTTVAKWFVPDARGTVDNVYRFGPLRDA